MTCRGSPTSTSRHRRHPEEEGHGVARQVSHVSILNLSAHPAACPSHLARLLGAVRRRAARPARHHHLCVVRRAAARALRPGAAASAGAGVARRPRGVDVALPRGHAALRRRDAGLARRRLDAAAPRAAARPRARPRSALHQGRIAQSDQLLQGARAVGGGDAGAAILAPACCRCRPPATPATPWPRTRRARASRPWSSCRAT